MLPAEQEIGELNAHRESWEMCCAQAQELPYRVLCMVGMLLRNKVPFFFFLKLGAEYCIAQSCVYITRSGLLFLFTSLTKRVQTLQALSGILYFPGFISANAKGQ